MRLIKLTDLLDLAILAARLPLSWFVPARAWPRVARWLGSLSLRLLGSRRGEAKGRIRDLLNVDPDRLELDFRQHIYWEILELLREHAPGGWRVPITVSGARHIEEALAAGKGAIFWYCPFLHGDIVFKRGICEAGYELHHLSALTHGFSDTRFALHFINPIKTSVEKRYLKERLVLDGKDSRPTLKALRDRLTANGLVSITAVHTGKRAAYADMFGGKLRLATGAPNQAIRTGAALLPLFVVPKGEGYQICIEAPLLGQAAPDEVKEEDYVEAYVPILERYVREHPELWSGWFAAPNHFRYGPARADEEDLATAAAAQ